LQRVEQRVELRVEARVKPRVELRVEFLRVQFFGGRSTRWPHYLFVMWFAAVAATGGHFAVMRESLAELRRQASRRIQRMVGKGGLVKLKSNKANKVNEVSSLSKRTPKTS
jgi:hypothetical protein